MLKKFSDFSFEKKDTKIFGDEKKSEKKPIAKKEVKEPEVKEPKTTDVKEPKTGDAKEPKMESVSFNGKVANFLIDIKPSDTLKLLESKNISKEKLHYIITEQTSESLVIIKYNQDAEYKINEFVNTLIDYYKRNENLKNIFSNITVEGTEHYSLINNIPDVEVGGKKLIKLLNDDLVKLLK